MIHVELKTGRIYRVTLGDWLNIDRYSHEVPVRSISGRRVADLPDCFNPYDRPRITRKEVYYVHLEPPR
ncbi:MAG: hypothetical protein GC159_17705 [Phycisphaera sp.]|nr:hypothetical protein [Phycisphaera sp.]